MAVIHMTTMNPGKLELLAPWLPAQPWYIGTGQGPALTKAGGFRLDDPRGEVGIEFMVVTDTSGGRPCSYHLPLTYRAAPLDGAGQALIGTSEHGVLGRRWVYDGTHDPVLVAQLLALLQGRAEPQAQSVTDTPDPSVTSHITDHFTGHATGAGFPSVVASAAVHDGQHGTDVMVEVAGVAGGAGEAGGEPRSESAEPLTIEVTRVLRPGGHTATAGARGHVTAGWRLPDGEERRGPFAVLRDTAR